MPSTNKGYPYPAGSVANNVPADLQALALAIEAAPGVPSLTQTQINALSGAAKTAGWIVFNSTAGRHQRWTGSIWRNLIEEGTATSGLLVVIPPDPHAGSYTLTADDLYRVPEMSAGGNLTVVAGIAPVGAAIRVVQTGTSQVTIVGSGVNVNGRPGLKLGGQWAAADLWRRNDVAGVEQWLAVGDLVA